MRKLTLVLFIGGVFWAFLCLGFLLGPFFAFGSQTFLENTLAIKILWYSLCLLLSLLTAVGYWIWIRWFKYYRTGLYPKMGRRRFWKLSLTHHLMWVILIPLFEASDDHDFSFNLAKLWFEGAMSFMAFGIVAYLVLGWITVNIFISIAQLLYTEE